VDEEEAPARCARRDDRLSGAVSRWSTEAAEDAPSTATSRMEQSEVPHAPPPPPRSLVSAAGSCTRAAAVALRQLSRLFSCSHEDVDGAAGLACPGAAFLEPWRTRSFLAGLFLDAARRDGVLRAGESDGGSGEGGGFFLRLLWCCWRRRSGVSVAVEAEEEGSRRLENAINEMELFQQVGAPRP
jgi:hypothetical protein